MHRTIPALAFPSTINDPSTATPSVSIAVVRLGAIHVP